MDNDFKKRTLSSGWRFIVVGFLLFGALFWPSRSQANPEGGRVVAGSAAITQTTPSRLDVIQQTDKAIIDWRSFDIKSAEHTNFQQPSDSAIALNRVRGGAASMIDGLLTANGRLFLINPDGVVFGNSARVNVGSLVATTTDIRNEDFLAGRYRFDQPSGNSRAQIINRGEIQASEGGAAVLAAPRVLNEGLIQARLGQVALAGTDTLTLDFHGDGLLRFEVGPITNQPGGVNGKAGEPLVSNPGTIVADGGIVSLTARAADALVDQVINMDGVIQARAVHVKGGVITLSGGDSGIVGVSGTLDASGLGSGQLGGTVKVLGGKVALLDGARIDARGADGGGEVFIGGNFQGKGPEPNAKRTYVDANARIAADAISSGNGGRVIIWADQGTGFYGDIRARGGSRSGDGGFVEVSGKENLVFRGTVDLGVISGKPGTLLLDPTNITIADFVVVPPGGPPAGDAQLPVILAGVPGQSLNISITALEALSPGATVILEATNQITINGGFGDGLLNLAATRVIFKAPTIQLGSSKLNIIARDASLILIGEVLVAVDSTITARSIKISGPVERLPVDPENPQELFKLTLILVPQGLGPIPAGPVSGGDTATFESGEAPPIVVTRPGQDIPSRDPTIFQFPNFGNEELWLEEEKAREVKP